LKNAQQEVIQHLKLFAPEGHAAGSIDLPSNLPPGEYQLLAYTNYQRNSEDALLFRKTIRIVTGLEQQTPDNQPLVQSPTLNNNMDVRLRFFPEGGDCVDGLPCTVAVVAEDEQGNPQEVEGYIANAQNSVAVFKTDAYGMGQFSYTPIAGQRYEGIVRFSDETISDASILPDALPKGYTLNVERADTMVRLLLRTNFSRGLRSARIVVHHRGLLFLNEKLERTEEATALELPYADLEPGVHVATLFDASEQPVAERLFFIAPDAANTEVSIALESSNFGFRQNVDMQFSVPTQDVLIDSLAKAQLSLSVIPESAVFDGSVDDIRSWLLLNSDLSELIPNASALIFGLRPDARDYLIDQFLMTRGWRRFRWEKLLDNFRPEFELERGISFSGQMVKQYDNDKARPGKVFLTLPEDKLYEEAMTDEDGQFEFGPYLLFDTTEFILQGRFKFGKKRQLDPQTSIEDNKYVNFRFDEEADSPEVSNFPLSAKATEVVERYQELSRKMLVTARNYDSLSVELETVNVTAQRLSKAEQNRKERSYLYGGEPSYRMVLDSTPGANTLNTMQQLFYQLPGVQVIGGSIQIQGPSSFNAGQGPLFVVDGVPTSFGHVSELRPFDVEFIDVLRGADATIFGARGGNGVILIYTRTGLLANDTYQRSPGIVNGKIVGFHKAREFAVFDPNATGNQNRPDIRTTLHWNPDLQTDEAGEVTDYFTTSDQEGTFRIIVQGLRADGQPLFGMATFGVEE